jgi:uncharacterized membrane protein
MAERDLLGVATTAKIGSHPLHPMLIPFPIALLVATFVCDVVYWATREPFWAQGALWLLVGAIVMSAAAALAGLTDFLGNAQVRAFGDAWKHMIGNVVAVALAIITVWMRYRYGAEQGALPWGIVLSGVIVLLLLYTGWKGGNLVYHCRIGMHPEAPKEGHTSRRPH